MLLTATTAESVLDGHEADLWSKLVTKVMLGGRIKTEMIPDDPSVN